MRSGVADRVVKKDFVGNFNFNHEPANSLYPPPFFSFLNHVESPRTIGYDSRHPRLYHHRLRYHSTNRRNIIKNM